MFQLLTMPHGNAKTNKGLAMGYANFSLALLPNTISGVNLCPFHTVGCAESCLVGAGRNRMPTAQGAKARRTRLFLENRDQFMRVLVYDIQMAIAWAKQRDLIPVFRLNCLSDIVWEHVRFFFEGKERVNIFELFPDVQFYDYTKIPGRFPGIRNYHLTFSRSEENDNYLVEELRHARNVAVVFRDVIPETFFIKGVGPVHVHNGDDHDLRFLDPHPVVIGLKAKGPARKDTSGFVVDVKEVAIV